MDARWNSGIAVRRLKCLSLFGTTNLSTAMDFIMTIDSDDEKRTLKYNGNPKNEEEECRIDSDFRFDLSEDPYVELLRSDHLEDVVKKIAKLVCNLFNRFEFGLSSYP